MVRFFFTPSERKQAGRRKLERLFRLRLAGNLPLRQREMGKPTEYVTYRGKAGQWSWLLHRLTGIGVLLFLLVHIADITLIGWGPQVFDRLLFLYRQPVFRLGEVVLVAAVLYHALNGIRLCIIDFWPAATAIHKKLTCAVAVIFTVFFVPTALYMLNWLMK